MRLGNFLIAAAATSLLFVVIGMSAGPANAIPAFARKYDAACSSCHTAWPLLNATGRKFKENGYKMKRTETPQSIISDLQQWDKSFPAAAVIKARPYDKKKGGDHKIRAIHEFELFVAGVIYKDISGFFEVEAEDETGFELEAGGWVSYHPHELLNITLAYDSIFTTDPYDTLSGARRLTRGRNAVIDQRLGGADNNGRLRDSRQSISIYGRVMDKVFYSATYSGVAGDAEGVNAKNISGRVAVDILPELTIGGFGVSGKCEATADKCDINRDFSRYGVDVQAEYAGAIFHGAFMRSKDDANALDDMGLLPVARNDTWYVEGIYVFRRDDAPWIVPSVRFDKWEKSGGMDKFSAVTMNLSFYPWENVKIYGEWFKEIDVPSGSTKNGRFTIQAEVGF